jgi:hypothetical protein
MASVAEVLESLRASVVFVVHSWAVSSLIGQEVLTDQVVVTLYFILVTI